jgi:predicted permease
LAALGFGLVPALHATRTELDVALKDETRGLTSRRHWYDARNLLVVSQVSICVVLLIATGLVWRSLDNRRSLDTGFDSRDVVVTSIWDREQSMSPESFVARLSELRNSLAKLPGVQAASLVTHAPMGLQIGGSTVDRGPSQETGVHQVTVNSLSPGFFDTLRVPLLAGRDFTEQDRAGNTPVAILSAKLAEGLFPGESALGQRVRAYGVFYEVIGVVGDVRYMRFDASYLSGTIYFSAAQVPFGNSPNLLVRSDRSNRSLTAAVVASVRAADPGRQHPVAQSYAKYMDEILAPERSATWLLGMAATIGLGLVSLGLYGVISYHVAQRTREIGLRMALGALRRQVLLLMLRRGLALTAVGTLVGGLAALGTSQLLRSLLHGVSTTDPVTFAGVCVLMIVTSTLACWLPGRRAMKIEPMEALRHD